jgi:glycosyltransferase involved in cell wall biosynthesis
MISEISSGSEAVPVFLVSFNRGAMLSRAIQAIRQFSRRTDIVIHDNGSTDLATLLILEELEASGIRVFRHPAIKYPDELNQVNDTVDAYFSDRPQRTPYVVSDCDIDVSISHPAALDIYNALLNKYGHINAVGPMLRIRDIPRSYPMFNRVMNRHIEQFWRFIPTLEDTSFGQVAFLESVIDTTFALHRAGKPFKRQEPALRVYEPFEARHLDWYLSESDDDVYTTTSSENISHWNNRVERARYREVALEYSEFFAVRRGSSGSLEIYEESILRPAATTKT